MSGDTDSIGLGYPAAIGAWTVDPTRAVITVTGEGGFGQCLAEITTAVKYGIPIKHVLLDNGSLGKIGKELDVDHSGVEDPDRHLGVEPDPSFVRRSRRTNRQRGSAVRIGPTGDHRAGAVGPPAQAFDDQQFSYRSSASTTLCERLCRWRRAKRRAG